MPDRPTLRFIYNVIRDRNYSRQDYIMNLLGEGGGRGGGGGGKAAAAPLQRGGERDYVDRLCRGSTTITHAARLCDSLHRSLFSPVEIKWPVTLWTCRNYWPRHRFPIVLPGTVQRSWNNSCRRLMDGSCLRFEWEKWMDALLGGIESWVESSRYVSGGGEE